VKSHVFSVRNHDKVFDSVVIAYAVNVVDILPWPQFPPEMLFHNPPMVCIGASFHRIRFQSQLWVSLYVQGSKVRGLVACTVAWNIYLVGNVLLEPGGPAFL
jgi:hypothetical protein